jgi:hypothetical protein
MLSLPLATWVEAVRPLNLEFSPENDGSLDRIPHSPGSTFSPDVLVRNYLRALRAAELRACGKSLAAIT